MKHPDITEIFEVRLAIEERTAHLAALHAKPQEIADAWERIQQ